jgi:hypothetical protein
MRFNNISYYKNNIDFFICLLIIIIICILYTNNNNNYDNFEHFAGLKNISNQDKKEMINFFKKLRLKYCPYLLFRNNVDTKPKKKISKKYSNLICYKNSYKLQPNLYIKYIGKNIGHGLFADQNFKKGDFIGEFCGTVTSKPHSSSDDYNYSYDDVDLVIAPRKIGNELQFANHSENPNVDWKHIVGKDQKVHVIFVAIKNIKKNDQILINYGEDYWKDDDVKKNKIDI